MQIKLVALIVGVVAVAGQSAVMAGDQSMGFFITSQGPGTTMQLALTLVADREGTPRAQALANELVTRFG